MLDAAAAERRATAGGTAAVAGGVAASQETWGSYLSRQVNERTEKLTFLNSGVDTLQDQSQAWADDINKFVNQQKRNLVMGSIKSKFF